MIRQLSAYIIAYNVIRTILVLIAAIGVIVFLFN